MSPERSGVAAARDPSARAADFLALLERSQRGRLKVYLGYAAGVGKTYRMLEEAHELRRRGVDVVVGIVETHGRAETAELVHGLEVVPLRRVEHRGVGIDEMDVDAVIARAPRVVIVDELAHTNAPGSARAKRYQDVEAILVAGINVLCAFNVQHLESLKDLVERETGVTIRETVPDTFLRQADQVVNLDLAIEDLQERLREGKIYGAEKVAQALENFFRDENLSTLRELSLREVAASVDRAATAQAQRQETPRRVRAEERVLVCLASDSPHASQLLRRGSRMAGRLSTDWYVAYVETPHEAPTVIDSTAQRHLAQNIDKARDLGAEFVRLHGTDPVRTLLEFAATHGVGHVVIGRTSQPWWRRLFGRSFVDRMIREASTFELHIVPLEMPGEGRA